jgi:hypothetical protein
MDRPLQPSDIYPAFSWPRLTVLGRILFDARKHVADQAEFERGDTLCSVGLRAWEQTKHAITVAAAYEYREWLSVSEPGSHFVFKLEMMPIRFLRADAEQPLPPNYAFADINELAAAELALGDSGQSVNGIFRVICEADNHGQPLGVHLLHADLQGKTIMTWQIPLTEIDTGIAPMVVPRTPIVLPELMVESEEEAVRRERAEKEAAERDDASKKGA